MNDDYRDDPEIVGGEPQFEKFKPHSKKSKKHKHSKKKISPHDRRARERGYYW